MKVEILKCSACNTYSLKQICTSCNGSCVSPKPAKYSVEDKWGKYRRLSKIQAKVE